MGSLERFQRISVLGTEHFECVIVLIKRPHKLSSQSLSTAIDGTVQNMGFAVLGVGIAKTGPQRVVELPH